MNSNQIQYYKNLLKNRWFNLRHGTKTKKSVYIIPPDHTVTVSMNRYLYLLAKFFAMNGYKVFVKARFNVFKELLDYAHFFLDEANVILVKKDVKADYIITYKEASKPNEIQMDYNYFGKGDGLYFPYTMQPGQYKFSYASQIDKFRANDRVISSLFIGGVSDNYKENDKIKLFRQKYAIINRYDAYNFLLNDVNNIIVPGNSEEAISYFESNERKNNVLLINTRNCIIRQPDWLRYISKADFIICLPGTEQPMCHHAIEAMGVGTIPILQYNMLFSPALEDMKNCIVFKDLTHLKDILSVIQTMPDDEIAQIRRNVIEYYDRYLSSSSFIERFEEYMNNDCLNKLLYVNIEYPHATENMR